MGIYLFNKQKREELRNSKKYAETNDIWNELGINKSFCVGYTMYLIDGCNSFEEWREKYFSSGKERLNILNNLDSITKKCNSEYRYYLENKKIPYGAIYKYNSEYGRTKEELEEFAVIFKEKLDELNFNISLEEAFAMVYMRVLEDTWKGYEKELLVIEEITKETSIELVHSSVDMDSTYAIDAIASKDGTDIFAIQIKPSSYLGDTDYLRKAKEQNTEKNKRYQEKFGIPVFYAYYGKEKVLINKKELLEKIRELA